MIPLAGGFSGSQRGTLPASRVNGVQWGGKSAHKGEY